MLERGGVGMEMGWNERSVSIPSPGEHHLIPRHKPSPDPSSTSVRIIVARSLFFHQTKASTSCKQLPLPPLYLSCRSSALISLPSPPLKKALYLPFVLNHLGHLLQASQRAPQEGLRALSPLRRWGGAHRLLQQGPPLRVLKQQVRGCASIDLWACILVAW